MPGYADPGFDTLALHAGAAPDPATGARAVPIHLTTSFVFESSDHAAALFNLERSGHVYSRISNPTNAVLEQRVAALEGGIGAITTASGQAALHLAVATLMGSGSHIVASTALYGGSQNLLHYTLRRFGIDTTFVRPGDLDGWRAALRPNTRLLFAETPTNPLTDLCDIAELAAIAHDAGVLLAVDNCFASPALQRPAMLGADLVIHSGTKFLDGQGRVMAGAVCGPRSIIDDKLAPLIRSAGVNLSPFNAWVVLKGMETLRIRMEAQSANALALAQWLEAQPQVARVYYPGLTSHPQHALAMRQQSGVGGAVLSFDVRANGPQEGRARAFHVIDSTRVCSITANLGDTKTTITHPASTSHGRLTEAQRQAAGIGQGLIRVAVGLEHIDDLKNDLARGLDTLS